MAADSPEGSQAAAANQRYTECLAEASSSDKCSTSYSQTPMVLLKHKEVQSGSSSNQTVACQATGYDIHDSFAELNKDQGDEAEDQLGSVLPSGAVVSSGETASTAALGCRGCCHAKLFAHVPEASMCISRKRASIYSMARRHVWAYRGCPTSACSCA